MNPKQKSGLITQPLGDELLIYDTASDRALYLNPTVSRVFEMCQGELSVEQMADSLKSRLEGDDLHGTVEESLAQLEEQSLLEEGFSASRRTFLKAAAAMAPLILAVSAPSPAMAQSGNACITHASCSALCTTLSCYGGSANSPCNPCHLGNSSFDNTTAVCTGNSYCMRLWVLNTSGATCRDDSPRDPGLVNFSCEPEHPDGHWHRNCNTARAWTLANQPVSNYYCCFCP